MLQYRCHKQQLQLSLVWLICGGYNSQQKRSFDPEKVVTLTLFLVTNSQTADQLIQGPYRFQFEVFSR